MKGVYMSNLSKQQDDSEMLTDYSEAIASGRAKAVRGKYHQDYRQLNGTVPVRIESANGERYVNLRTIETEATIADNGQLIAEVFADLKPGKYAVTIIIEEPAK
jgi:uncharacterized protein (DUF2141 family)